MALHGGSWALGVARQRLPLLDRQRGKVATGDGGGGRKNPVAMPLGSEVEADGGRSRLGHTFWWRSRATAPSTGADGGGEFPAAKECGGLFSVGGVKRTGGKRGFAAASTSGALHL